MESLWAHNLSILKPNKRNYVFFFILMFMFILYIFRNLARERKYKGVHEAEKAEEFETVPMATADESSGKYPVAWRLCIPSPKSVIPQNAKKPLKKFGNPSLIQII